MFDGFFGWAPEEVGTFGVKSAEDRALTASDSLVPRSCFAVLPNPFDQPCAAARVEANPPRSAGAADAVAPGVADRLLEMA